MTISAPISNAIDVWLPNTPELVDDPKTFAELMKVYQAIKNLQAMSPQVFAAIAGSASQTFKVAPATTGTMAPQAGQIGSSVTSVTATQSGGAITFGLNPCILGFRATTLTDGTASIIFVPSVLSLALPSGGTLGFPTTIQGRIIVVAINNAGTAELAVIALSGGVDLSETGVISTTAISASATANNVFYSTTARTNVAYRVVGAVDAVNTTGAWGNPVLVQGAGGNALLAMSSLGYGQTWVSNGSGITRVPNTTYYNTTGRTIAVQIVAQTTNAASAILTLSLDGAANSLMQYTGTNAGDKAGIFFVVRPGGSYMYVDGNGGAQTQPVWKELR